MPEIASHIRSAVEADGAAILDIERNEIVTLNATGGFVWDRLRRGESVDSIVRELSEATGTDLDVVEADVRAFLGQLAEKHLFGK